jgi:hypothetical protein
MLLGIPTSRGALLPHGSDGGGAGRKGETLLAKQKKKVRNSGWKEKTATNVQLVHGCVRLVTVFVKLVQIFDDWTN